MRGVRHRLPDRGQHDGACDQDRTKMTGEYVTTSFNALYVLDCARSNTPSSQKSSMSTSKKLPDDAVYRINTIS